MSTFYNHKMELVAITRARSPKDAKLFCGKWYLALFIRFYFWRDVCMIWNRSVHLTLNGIYCIPPEPDGCGLLCSWPPKKHSKGKLFQIIKCDTYTDSHTHTENKISGRIKSIWRANDKLCQLNCHTKNKMLQSHSLRLLHIYTQVYIPRTQEIFIWLSFYTSISTLYLSELTVSNWPFHNHNHNESNGNWNISNQCLASSFIIEKQIQ